MARNFYTGCRLQITVVEGRGTHAGFILLEVPKFGRFYSAALTVTCVANNLRSLKFIDNINRSTAPISNCSVVCAIKFLSQHEKNTTKTL